MDVENEAGGEVQEEREPESVDDLFTLPEAGPEPAVERPPRLRMEHEKRTLRCLLMDHEIRQKGQELAYGLRRVAQHEADLAAAKSQFKSVIDREQATVDTLREAVATGAEFREVTCDVFYDYETMSVQVFRRDTCEELVHERRGMTDAEKQRVIDFDAPAAL